MHKHHYVPYVLALFMLLNLQKNQNSFNYDPYRMIIRI
jgi:hypothetical protein